MNHSLRNKLIRIILLLAMLCLITNCNQNSNEPLTKNATPVGEENGPAGMVHIDDGGVDGVPVILLHSFAGDTSHWTAQLDHLRKSRRAVAFDLRGHGQSAPSTQNDYSIDSLAGDLGAVVDKLNLPRFVLVGHSIGGAVALAYAGKNPDRVAGLVLVGTPGKVSPEQSQPIMKSLESDYDKAMEAYWQRLLANARPEVLQRVTDGKQKMPQDRSLKLTKATFDYDPTPALGNYRGPKLFVTSSFDNQPNSLHNLAPGSQRKVMDGTSHWPHMDKPDEFNRILDEFLSAIDSPQSRSTAQK